MNQIPSKRLCGIRFTSYSKEEILNLSVKEITNTRTFDAFLHPSHGGLYDPALGPTDRDDVCGTCSLTFMYCPGHFGHILLPLPVYNPVFFKLLVQILKGTCLHCHHLLASRVSIGLLKAQLQCLEYGLLSAIDDLENIVREFSVADDEEETVADIEVINTALNKYVEKVLQGLDKKEAVQNACVRNITERRQTLVEIFKKTQLQHENKCGLCKNKVNGLRSQHNSKIYFKHTGRRVLVRKTATEKETQQNGEDKENDESSGKDNTSQNRQNVQEKAVVLTDINKVYLTPQEARGHLTKLFQNEGSFLHHLFGSLAIEHNVEKPKSIDAFFLEVVPVPPSRFRPISRMNEQQFENPQTANLSSVLLDCVILRQLLQIMKREESTNGEDAATTLQQLELDMSVLARVPGESKVEKLQNSWVHLQSRVNCLIDSELDKLSTDKHPGIRQILEKKEGLFRKHMMGKRVNYAARSVISPDPNIATDEIGIPEVIAKRLTYPQPVTPWNVVEMRQAVINGPNQHPGAIMLENPDGSKIILNAGNKTQREAIAKQLLTPHMSMGVSGPKKVHRHVKNGDVLLINRQPTLHKPSIMAHKARILRGEKTLRLHYANCKSYNADFDGDEMNVHFPQNELARAEAYNIMTTTEQYLVPKDSTPLSGLIQDHMVAGVRLTTRGRFFNRKDYQHLVYSALTDKDGPVYLLPPTIIKPCKLWSGKQVLSTVLLNIVPENKEPLNFKGKTKISSKNWQACKPRLYVAGGTPLEGDDMTESEVVVRGGELLCGVLDKAHYGPTPYGLVHCCYELYGGKVSGRLLTCLARLFTAFLQSIAGFTLGVEDILVKGKADKKRRKALNKAAVCGNEVAAKALRLDDPTDTVTLLEKMEDAHRSPDGNDMKEIDLCMKSKTDEVTNAVNKICMPDGLHKQFPENCLQLMVQSGAKGSQVNCMQISCLLGQIELEGRRPPVMVSGRSLPSFLPYDTSPRAGGFVDGRFLTGIRPQEYFFHCMAGREGLVDTAVKTSRSGYLQRCLIKHLEGLVIGYDLTVRDSDGSIIQFQYGEDCLDILKTPFLREQQFPFLISNHNSILDDKHLKKITEKLDTESAVEEQHKVRKWKRKHEKREGRKSLNPFIYYCNKKSDKVLAELRETEAGETGSEVTGLEVKLKKRLVETWRNMDDKHKYIKHSSRCPDPVLTRLRPDLNFGSTSENFTKMTESYIEKNPHGLLCAEGETSKKQISPERFKTLMNMKYLTSLCEPGEAVGLLAAQSIGEPSTQMTLNTFHFAGRGEMNVTLGIPRLREILMVGSKNIKTPSMSMPIISSQKAMTRAKRIKKRLTKVYLSEVIENINVCESYEIEKHGMKFRIYKIKLSFLPEEYYKDKANLTSSDIMYYVEMRFMKRLSSAIKKKLREINNIRIMDSETRSSVLNDDLEDVPELRNQLVMETDQDNYHEHGDDEDDDEDDDDEDGDGAEKKRSDDCEYEEDGDEIDEEEEDESDGEDKQNGETQGDEEGEEREDTNDAGQTESTTTTPKTKNKKTPKKKKKKEKDAGDEINRVEAVLSCNNWIFDYRYDVENNTWCEVSFRLDILGTKMDMCSVVREETKKCVVHETPGITRCFLVDSTNPQDLGSKVLQTEGVNIMEMFKYHKTLNLHRLYTNDIHAMANTYGIEAARRVIIQEIQGVFKAYGIYVNSRHLTLIADYMTFDGIYRPFNRVSLASNSSPLQKMTFEQSMTFLRQATIDGAYDQLKSPSARLVVGRVVSGGTGAFDLVQPLV